MELNSFSSLLFHLTAHTRKTVHVPLPIASSVFMKATSLDGGLNHLASAVPLLAPAAAPQPFLSTAVERLSSGQLPDLLQAASSSSQLRDRVSLSKIQLWGGYQWNETIGMHGPTGESTAPCAAATLLGWDGPETRDTVGPMRTS
jgi:hypothetical protein